MLLYLAGRAPGMQIEQPESPLISNQSDMKHPLSTSPHKNCPQAVFSAFYPVTIPSPGSTNIHKPTSSLWTPNL